MLGFPAASRRSREKIGLAPWLRWTTRLFSAVRGHTYSIEKPAVLKQFEIERPVASWRYWRRSGRKSSSSGETGDGDKPSGADGTIRDLHLADGANIP